MEYKLIIKKAEEGGFIGMVPDIPGALTQGESEEEVRENMKDAIMLLRKVRMKKAIKDLGSTSYRIEPLEV